MPLFRPIDGISNYGARPLSRYYLRSYLVKNIAGAHKEPSKKYKNNLLKLKNKLRAMLN